jgi:2'-5' RNA ligase
MALTAAGESALIVPVDVPMAMRRLRDRMDPSATLGVPTHITLLYPFVPAAGLDDGVKAQVSHIVSREPAFPFTLVRVQRWPEVVCLLPEPSLPFGRLIAALAAAFPDFQPYGGAIALPDIVPHLTIAHTARSDYLNAAEHALPALLPVPAFCREVALIAHPPGERWRVVSGFSLAADTDG